MNPLTYFEIFSFLFRTNLFYDIFDIIEFSHLFRKHPCPGSGYVLFFLIFRPRWILSPMSKCPLFCSLFDFSYDISDKWILSLIPRYLLSFSCTFLVLYYFDIDESSHLYQNIYFLPLPKFFCINVWILWCFGINGLFLNCHRSLLQLCIHSILDISV